MRNTLTAIAACAALGCATNLQKFEETTTDANGLVSTVTYTQKAVVTQGSKQDSAAGDMAYTGPDWGLSVGNAASGQRAGDADKLLLGIIRMIAPLLAPLPAIPAPASVLPSASPANAVTGLVDVLGTLAAPSPP